MRLPSRFITFTLVIMLLAVVFSSAAGQNPGSITVKKLDTSAYPLISATFTALDPSGGFVKDLKTGELWLSENSAAVTSYTLEMEQVGVRFFVAINEGPTLDNRFSGVMRIDRIKTALFNWVAAQPAPALDEFHLVVNEGALQFNPLEPSSWYAALDHYQPDLKTATPGMASLSAAVDNALNNSLQSPKATALLFITPLPTEVQLAAMQEIIARAKSNNLHIFIWLIGPQDYGGSDTAVQLERIARDTGGQFIIFSGAEELPAIADLLDPFEFVYHLSYKTANNISGEYSLVLEIKRGELVLASEPVTYELAVSPPNPIFLSPPSTIERSWSETKKKSASVLIPEKVNLKILVEFPDGMQRELVNSRLFVDGGLADERSAPPFDTFTWDLSKYTESGLHNLQVIIEDAAGLTGQTIQLPVEVKVAERKITAAERLLEQLTLVNGIIMGVILLVLLIGLVLLVKTLKKRIKKRPVKKPADPVTQPVNIEGEYTLAPPQPETTIQWPVIRGVGLAPARLIQKRSAAPVVDYLPEIPLGNDEVLIGSERRKADYVLVHSTVSPLHARIYKDADGNYRIADSGSAAGTWVNYAPVSTRGVQLEHGDLVQFGRLAYIFELHGAAPRRVKVLPYQED